jgi:hypothetical protein
MPGVEPGSEWPYTQASTCVADLFWFSLASCAGRQRHMRAKADWFSLRRSSRNPCSQFTKYDALSAAYEQTTGRQTAALSRHRVRIIVRSYKFPPVDNGHVERPDTRPGARLPPVESKPSPVCKEHRPFRAVCWYEARSLVFQPLNVRPPCLSQAPCHARRKPGKAGAQTGREVPKIDTAAYLGARRNRHAGHR